MLSRSLLLSSLLGLATGGSSLSSALSSALPDLNPKAGRRRQKSNGKRPAKYDFLCVSAKGRGMFKNRTTGEVSEMRIADPQGKTSRQLPRECRLHYGLIEY